MNLTGHTLGQYQIVKPIGSGGMATVYKAYQAGLDRYVAIKVLPAQHALTPGFKERFLREAKAVAQLSHPNILPIYDIGIEDDISFFVMKFVESGQTLREVMRPLLPLSDVCRYIDQIAAALDHAHERGILHRDIKPVNVLLEGDWVLLADFGLAKIVEGSEALTASGSTMGTPAYVSPEQAVGDPVDHRTDIYSLGVILYEMVVGEVPYTGETPMGVMFKHVYEPLPIPRQINPDLPEGVERVILKALVKNREHRYNSAGELAQALNQAVASRESGVVAASEPDLEQTIAHLSSPTQSEVTRQTVPGQVKVDRSKVHSPWLWFGGGLLMLIVVGAIIALALGGQDEQLEPDQVEQVRATGVGQDTTAELPQAQAEMAAAATATTASTAAPDTPTVEPEATNTPRPTANAASTRSSGNLPPTSNLATNLEEVEWLEPVARLGGGTINEIALNPDEDVMALAGSLGIWLYDLETFDVEFIEGPGSVTWTVAWSPAGDELVTGHQDGSVRLWDVESGEEIDTFLEPTNIGVGEALNVAWSADGSRIAASSEDGKIRVWAAKSGDEVSLMSGHLYEPYRIAWSADGERLASASRDTTVRIWDIDSGGELQRLEGHLDQVSGVTWSPDSSLVASSGADFTIRLWDAETGQEVDTLSGHEGWVTTVVWSADGDRLASAGADGTIRLWDVEAGEEIDLLEEQSYPIIDLMWAAGGEQLIAAALNGVVVIWDIEAGEFTELSGIHNGSFRSVTWSPDGDLVAVGGEDSLLRIWDVTDIDGLDEEEPLALEGHDDTINSVAWSPDGTELVSGSDDQTIIFWDFESEEIIDIMEGHEAAVNGLAWSPDDRLVASADDEGLIRLWDPVSGAQLRELEGHADRVTSLTWSPAGEQLASGSWDRSIGLWEAVSGENLDFLEGRTGWDAYQQEYSLRGPAAVTDVAWSPDGEQLAGAGGDFVVRLWAAESGAELRLIEGHTASVLAVAWSPDSRLVASAGRDRTIRLWDAANGKQLYALVGHEDTINSLDWSPDGAWIASAGEDGTVRLWAAPEE